MIAGKIVHALDQAWSETEPLRVGDPAAIVGTPACYVLVEGDGVRLRCDVYPLKEQACIFEDVQIWRNLLLVGYGSALYWVHLPTRAQGVHTFRGYFGSLQISDDWCLVAFDSGLVRLGADGAALWRRDDLALDGVIVGSVGDDIITLDAEMDPPDGWIERTVRLSTGETIED